MKYGLIGEKLSHSFSPQIHSLLADYEYRLYELEENEIEAFIHSGNIGGMNVTIPYKQTVIPFCDEISPEAERIGSVNTIVYSGNHIVGHNTDYYGFTFMLSRAGISPKGKKSVILGSGGTCQTAKTVLMDLGASEIVVISRSGRENYQNISRHYDAELIINTTPVGMYPNCPNGLIQLKNFYHCSGVVDVIYNPHRTALFLSASRLGIPVTDGLPMLVAQAKEAAALFTGKHIDDNRNEDILQLLRRKLENIILIGMPGSGKSSAGRLIAKKLGRQFIDIDSEIERSCGVSIPEIFEKYGELHFRSLEHKAILEHGRKSGAVIATGGGSVLDSSNYFPLKQNGRIYFLERELDRLATNGRPLSTGIGALREMYSVRLPMYASFCDKQIDSNRSIEEVAAEISEDFYENTCD